MNVSDILAPSCYFWGHTSPEKVWQQPFLFSSCKKLSKLPTTLNASSKLRLQTNNSNSIHSLKANPLVVSPQKDVSLSNHAQLKQFLSSDNRCNKENKFKLIEPEKEMPSKKLLSRHRNSQDQLQYRKAKRRDQKWSCQNIHQNAVISAEKKTQQRKPLFKNMVKTQSNDFENFLNYLSLVKMQPSLYSKIQKEKQPKKQDLSIKIPDIREIIKTRRTGRKDLFLDLYQIIKDGPMGNCIREILKLYDILHKFDFTEEQLVRIVKKSIIYKTIAHLVFVTQRRRPDPDESMESYHALVRDQDTIFLKVKNMVCEQVETLKNMEIYMENFRWRLEAAVVDKISNKISERENKANLKKQDIPADMKSFAVEKGREKSGFRSIELFKKLEEQYGVFDKVAWIHRQIFERLNTIPYRGA